MRWGAVVVAAGRGTRFGRPKQLVEIAGVPMVAWSLRTFARMPEIVELVVVTEEAWLEPMRELVAALEAPQRARVVAGGATRQGSVSNGLRALSDACNALFVHDGARPLVLAQDVRAGMREVRPGRGAVLAAPVVDTVKVVDPATMTVRHTLDRGTLWAAQTPQFAWRRDLERAHAHAQRGSLEATDDVALLEAIGVEVAIVPASGENFKVTHPHDLAHAELLLRERAEHVPLDEEILLVEVFADESLVAAIEREFEARGARIDAVERDLPQGVTVRAFVRAESLRGFSERFEAFADGSATFTTRFSHYAGASEAGARG
ncbi:MAG: 2-C-methyl-D-erythritol 4-phosphate cytidylyltransferase [bacterium]|nr:2-C-methyl-D-erythritol 4-phosphate cytidylyltransferase [bacterium]